MTTTTNKQNKTFSTNAYVGCQILELLSVWPLNQVRLGPQGYSTGWNHFKGTMFSAFLEMQNHLFYVCGLNDVSLIPAEKPV